MGFLTDIKVLLPYGLPVGIINIWEKKFQFIVSNIGVLKITTKAPNS